MSNKISVVSQMDLLQPTELDTLLTWQGQPCVSIYMPTHREWSEIPQDRLRLKNLLSEAEQKLAARELISKDIRDTLEQAYLLERTETFWHTRSNGLALFLSAKHAFTYKLPLHFEELVVVDDRFHIKPLLNLFEEQGHYFVLTLSQGNIRLFEGTQNSLKDLDLQGVPTSLAEALQHDVFEKQQQVHSGAARTGKQGAIYHGHGTAADDAYIKKRIKEFFKQVDNSVTNRLAGKRAPLVLAGLDHLRGLYRSVNHYKYISEKDVSVNPEMLSLEELRSRVWALVEPYFGQVHQEAVSAFDQLASTEPERISTQLEHIVSAACFQRVKVLFVRQGAHAWGTFDSESQHVEVHNEAGTADHDLIDLAVVHTLRNAGNVYIEKADEMPGRADIAAIFRF